MIEIAIDKAQIERALKRLNGIEYRLNGAIKVALGATVPIVRAEIIGVLEKDVIVGKKFIARAVKRVRKMREGSYSITIASKSLFLDDYAISPRRQTATLGVQSTHWEGFNYKLRHDGKMFNSRGTLTGTDYNGSTPFIAETERGELRVMYRHKRRQTPFLAYAPSIQYHAVGPHVQEAAEEKSMEVFHQKLMEAVNTILAGGTI